LRCFALGEASAESCEAALVVLLAAAALALVLALVVAAA
jgi:hypothetical protein